MKGKKLIVILAPVLLLGGVAGAALTGVITIPGLTPKRGKAANLYNQDAAGLYAEKKDDAPKPPIKPKESPKPAVSAEPESDPTLGRKKLAQLWNNIETQKLLEIASGYKDDELAPVLVQMDPEKVSELLGALDPKRATALSKSIEQESSRLTKKDG